MNQKDIKLGSKIVVTRAYPLDIRKRFPGDDISTTIPHHPHQIDLQYNVIAVVVGMRNLIMDDYKIEYDMDDFTRTRYPCGASGKRENVIIACTKLWRVPFIVRLCDCALV